VFIFGQMVLDIKGSGSLMKCPVKVSLNGQMEEILRENLKAV